jgi:hypothetical protein
VDRRYVIGDEGMMREAAEKLVALHQAEKPLRRVVSVGRS